MSNRYSSSANEHSAGEVSVSISEADIADYLRNHPDFFRDNASLLGEISLPHVSGNAVSLVERQVAVLRERSISTRRKLSELVDNAKDNDELFNKTQALVLKLIKAEEPEALFSEIEQSFASDFDVQHSAIFLLGDDSQALAKSFELQRIKSPADASQTIGPILDNGQTTCGAIRDSESAFVFGTSSGAVASAAVALRELSANQPLKLLLAVGHGDGNHYGSETGTLFIDYIADVLQVLINRML